MKMFHSEISVSWSSVLMLLCFCAVVQGDVFRRVKNLRRGKGEGSQRGPIKEALFLGEEVGNATQKDCIYRRGVDRDRCPDPDIRLILYTLDEDIIKKSTVELARSDWLRTSSWDPLKSNVILIHGYAGGDDTLPIVVLRDAYIMTGRYNVFMVDWGVLCQPPCYVAAVHNVRPVAKCLAEAFSSLRERGLPLDTNTDCVGHSLGAHICGVMANYLTFRLHRIIGLDPARPLVKSGNAHRLDAGDARSVQVLHTNAGKYGEIGKIGHVDICINGGRVQPYCSNTTNEDLCSHIWSLCYMAQSLYEGPEFQAEPCSRRCPVGLRPSEFIMGPPISIGEKAPLDAYGSYCLKDHLQPFCPTETGQYGDLRCCIKPKKYDSLRRPAGRRRLMRDGRGVIDLLN